MNCRSGELELSSIKLLMGYNAFKQVDYSNLTGASQNLKSSGVQEMNKISNDILCLDLIRFEYLDWKFQMIYASNLKNTLFPCSLNERAMELLYFSSVENKK